MEIIAKARHIRMSPRKVRLVVDLVRGLAVNEAETQLKFLRKDAARPVLKLIRSAVANAEHNFKQPTETLYIKRITVDGGPVLSRWRPRAFGRATPIRKRSSHITVILDQRDAKEQAAGDLAAAAVKTPDKSKKAAVKPAKKEKPQAQKAKKQKSAAPKAKKDAKPTKGEAKK